MKTQSLQQLKGKKKSKHTFSIRSSTSRQIISNNISEKRFQANVFSYRGKQQELQRNFMELIKIHQKCKRSSKCTSLSKKINIEDIEQVVARIVNDTFGMRVVYNRRSRENEESKTGRDTASQDDEVEQSNVPFGVTDIRVWDRRSPYDGVLEEIARKLVDVCSRLWAEASGTTAEMERLSSRPPISCQSAGSLVEGSDADAWSGIGRPEVDRLSRDLAEVMVCMHNALSAKPDHVKNGPTSRETTTLIATQQKLRTVRDRLALVTDRLKVTTKEKRDLLDVLQRNQSNPTAAESLQAMLDKEKEKNVRLQSVVDEMFYETARNNK